jgi:hypothetical protein
MATAAVVATVAIVAPLYVTSAAGSGTRLGEGGGSRTVPGIGWADGDDPDAVGVTTGDVADGMLVSASRTVLVVCAGPNDDAGCFEG